MNTNAKVIIAVLGSLVLGLGIALGGVLWQGGDDGAFSHHMGGDSYNGMMTAIGLGDSDQMLERMEEILGPEGYQAMLTHMAAHHSGETPSDTTVDSMMHQMMDGITQRMPADRHNMMPFRMHQ